MSDSGRCGEPVDDHGLEVGQPAFSRAALPMSRPLPPLSAMSFVLMLFSLAVGGCSGERSTVTTPVSAPPSGKTTVPAVPAASVVSAASARAALTAEESQLLLGWWLRYDQKYMIVIEAVAADGRLTARYLNPDPVGVSKAEAWKVGERVELLLELTDENYPGNFYELSFDPERQILAGVYHHLALKEDFEVDFTRFEEKKSVAVQPK